MFCCLPFQSVTLETCLKQLLLICIGFGFRRFRMLNFDSRFESDGSYNEITMFSVQAVILFLTRPSRLIGGIIW